MGRLLVILVCVSALQWVAFGDIYMHNPRGSNDRNCERTVNRQNGNRLFNSQNNNNGGYACPRGVGDETFQAENGDVVFNSVDTSTGQTTQFTQNKRIYYYEGSVLPIEWTNQHGCGGNSKIKCEVVIQYACEDTLDPRVDNFWPWTTGKGDSSTTYYGKQHFRSGDHIAAPRDGVPRDSDDAATNTIPENEASAIPNTKETRRFGMQENYDYYEICRRTERNKGLYTADQLVRRTDRRGTRQNPNGNRHGFECPEERDYYPWWAPSPWIDIAVLSDEAKDDGTACYPSTTQSDCSKRCQYYMSNTMNFNAKGYCDPNHSSGTAAQKTGSDAWNQRKWYNNEAKCIERGFNWYTIKHDDNIPMDADKNFVCAHTQYSRTNQLGNSDGVVSSQNDGSATSLNTKLVAEGLNANRFMWTVPDVPAVDASTYFGDIEDAYKSCVLRIRYNISSGDFQQWPKDAKDDDEVTMVDSRNSSSYEGDPKTPLSQDPYVYIGPGDLETKGDKFLAMAVNTNQYGRTFQDRSYVFSIKKRPTANADSSTQLDTPEIDYDTMQANLAAGGRIFNVNVRGKRGNIVQTFPSVEYDFVPNNLVLSKNDMVHFQWTGSDYNPRRGCNNGEGGPPDTNAFSTDANAAQNPRADRQNLVFTDAMSHNLPRDYTGYDTTTNPTYAEKVASAKAAVLADAPCYDSSTDSTATADQCYAIIMRLAYLNQQRDGGALSLRGGAKCLTLAELNTIAEGNRDVAEYHPLNCAKINAKPHPYYDAGLMFLKKAGLFSYFSSRNNNFSNRQQIGRVCVSDAAECTVDTEGRVTFTGAAPAPAPAPVTASTCVDKSMVPGEANANGASSCMGGSASDPTDVDSKALLESTEAVNESDNDFKGEGNAKGCAPQNNYADTYITNNSGLSVEEQVGLAIGLLAAGVLLAWVGWLIFRRWNPRKENEDRWLRNSTYERVEGAYNSKDASHYNEGWTRQSQSPGGRAEAGTADGGATGMGASSGDRATPGGKQKKQKEKERKTENSASPSGSRPVSARPNTEDIYGDDSRSSVFSGGNPFTSFGTDPFPGRAPPAEPAPAFRATERRQKKATKSQRINYL